MIKQKTTFVLGAGASMHLEFPSGDGLRRRVLEIVERNIQNMESHEQASRLEIESNAVIENKPRATLCEHFKSVAGALRFSPSVDHCLAQTADLNSGTEYAKLATALIKSLVWLEIAEHQEYQVEHAEKRIEDWQRMTPELKERNKAAKKDGNWYYDLWCLMNQELHRPSPDAFWNNNNVHFITFNYDTSLEVFLLKAYTDTYSPSPTEQATFVERLKERIIHVYGTISADDSTDFKPGFMAQDSYDDRMARSFRSRERIRTFNDKAGGARHLDKIDIKITDSRTYILGSSLNAENIKILFPKRKINVHRDSRIKVICLDGTYHGVSEQSLEVVKTFINRSIKCDNGISPFIDGKCGDFMMKYQYILAYSEE